MAVSMVKTIGMIVMVGLIMCVCSSFAEEANLMVAKDFKEDYVVLGRNLTVVYTFHNVGDG
jgi:hypothetical protein